MRTNASIIIALDYASANDALKIAEQLDPQQCRLKVGKELFIQTGPGLVENLMGKGFDVFLDLKFHDIPNTVAQACAGACELEVWMLTVHALGGRIMMQAAREAIDKHSRRPLLIAVTLLTSLGQEDVVELGFSDTPQDIVLRLANLANSAKLDGVVCSPQEVTALRGNLGNDFQLVTPGIRLQSDETDDQKRVMTPGQAIRAGSNYLVIGRPVTRATDPMAALQMIEKEIIDAQSGH